MGARTGGQGRKRAVAAVRDQPQCPAHECGFARAIGADDTHQLARTDLQIDIAQDVARATFDAKAGEGEQAHSPSRRVR